MSKPWWIFLSCGLAWGQAGFRDYSGVVGTNYTHGEAVNQIQHWVEFDTVRIAREMAMAGKIGLNALRVFLHYHPYEQDKALFLGRVEKFLGLADRSGIRIIYVFFDDVWYGDDRVFQFVPIKGAHNGRWARSPLLKDRAISNYPRFKAYVQDVIRAHATDGRVLAWEVWNEPENNFTPGQPIDVGFTREMMAQAFAWARGAGPVQPVIACWSGNTLSDVDNQHTYEAVGILPDAQRGTLVTEAGCRAWGDGESSNGSPMEWIHWLSERKRKHLPVPGVFLTWELMAGNSHTRWHWSSKVGDPEPAIPWCGLLYPDGTPVSLAEAEAIRRYSLRDTQAVLLDDFQDNQLDGWNSLGGTWKLNASGNVMDLRVLAGAGAKRIWAGDPAWKDYTVQATVRLLGDGTRPAGLLIRANPLPGGFQGYFCGFSRSQVGIWKLHGNSSVLLIGKNLPPGDYAVVPGVRNSLKVVAERNLIRVFLNDPRTADISYSDSSGFLAGGIGFQAVDGEAHFDDVVVIPARVSVGVKPGKAGPHRMRSGRIRARDFLGRRMRGAPSR